MSNAGELACTYACLILCDEGIPITAEKISALVKAAKVPNVESYWPSLFVKLAEKRNIEDLILDVSAGGGGAVGGVATPPTGGGVVADVAVVALAKKEEKKEEVVEESDDDLFGFFDE